MAQPARRIERDIGGGKAERATELAALPHHALDEIGMAEQTRGERDVAGLQRFARRRRGDRLEAPRLVLRDARHDLDGKAQPLALRAQKIRIAGARGAEAEVIARDGGGDAEPAREDLLGEFPRRPRREGRIEGQYDHAVEVKAREQRRLGVGRRQPEDHRAPGEDIGRMRLEGEQSAGLAEPPRERLRMGDDAAVAAMQPVEIADRHHGALEPRRGRRRIAGDDEGMRERQGGVQSGRAPAGAESHGSRSLGKEPEQVQ